MEILGNMKMLNKKIVEFLEITTGKGNGYGYGYGYGYGNGYGNGNGYGYGDGKGNGNGSGNGYGYDDGKVNGYGYGNGNGEGIKAINGHDIYFVDEIPTIFTNVHENYAKGFIVENNVCLRHCFIIKSANGLFAHGKTLREAQVALEGKLFEELSVAERINEFVKRFELSKKYPAIDFFNWHNRLTGSCEIGRKTFAKNHNIDIQNDLFTVEEFIDLTENSYGGSIIRQLAKAMGLKARRRNELLRY